MFQPRAIARMVGICGLLAWAFSGLARAENKQEGARLLFLGNSITLHGPAESIGWTGNWGMAASAEEKDYVHLLVNAVARRNGRKPEVKVVNLADFERGFEQYDLAAKLTEEVAFQADTVILAIGENVPELKTDEARAKFGDSVSRLLKLLKGDRRCAIYVRSCFWPHAAKDSALKQACATVGGGFVDISELAKDERNYARSERKIAHAGVAAHPGDAGMSAIANLIFAAMTAHGGAVSPPAKEVPSGLRLAGGGNSWYAENCGPYAKEAGIEGHQFVRASPNPANAAPRTPLELAEKGEIDAFVWGHTDGFGGAEASKSKMLLEILEAGLKKNPDFKLYIQVPWLVHDGRNPAPADIDYEDSDLAEVQAKLDARRKVEETAADETNAKFGKRVVFLVPMSDAMMELRRMIAAGKFPGVAKHSAVFAGDHMPHASALGAALGEMCHFAAIYGMSPEGLPKTAAMNRLEGLDENQIKILQKLAWESVSKYPHAGVVEQPPEKEPKQGDEIENSLGMRLNYLPPGTFQMGSPEGEPGRESQEVQHEMTLSKGLYLGVHEVTVGKFREFILDSGHTTESEKDGKGSWGITSTGKFEQDAKYNWTGPGFKQTDDHPVVDVSWNDAKAFCQWLSKKEKRTYRLPTEAEWEYACRAGTHSAYAFGDDPQGLVASGNVADATARAEFTAWALGIKGKDGYPYTAPVGQFKPNQFGLYDMHGNVWEWCEDWFDEDAYTGTKRIDPTGPESGTKRVHRGGGWSSAPERCRSAARIGRHPSSYRGCYLGFRVVLELNPLSATPPVGLRVLYNGNSWHNYVPLYFTGPLVKAAGIEGHKMLGNLSFEQSTPLLETGEVDAYSFGVDPLADGKPSPR